MSGTSADPIEHGLRVVRHDEIGQGGARELVARLVAALTHTPTGIGTMTAQTLELASGAGYQADHQRTVESVISVIDGEIMIRWGARLEFSATAGPGDLLIVPAGVPYQLHARRKRCRIYFLEGT
jgi:uncharacterized RmlC-like cupin family protein